MVFFSWLQSPLTSTMFLFSINLSSLFLYKSDFSFSLFMFQLSVSLSLCLTVVLEHAAGIWWMITCHSLFIIIQTINYTSLMLVVPLEIYMLGTDQCENGISFAKCLSVGTAWWLQSGCFNSCVCLTMSSLTACHRSHCSKALFIGLCRQGFQRTKMLLKALCSRQVGKVDHTAGTQFQHPPPAFASTGENACTLSTFFSFLFWMTALR